MIPTKRAVDALYVARMAAAARVAGLHGEIRHAETHRPGETACAVCSGPTALMPPIEGRDLTAELTAASANFDALVAAHCNAAEARRLALLPRSIERIQRAKTLPELRRAARLAGLASTPESLRYLGIV